MSKVVFGNILFRFCVTKFNICAEMFKFILVPEYISKIYKIKIGIGRKRYILILNS